MFNKHFKLRTFKSSRYYCKHSNLFMFLIYYGRGSQTFWSATQKADFVLACDPQFVIFGLIGHFEWYNILLGKLWRP